MATVWLARPDCEEGTLPRICVRCGRPATRLVEKDLGWTLVWASPIRFFIGGERSSVPVLVPTCDAHHHHWRDRQRPLNPAWLVWLAVGGPLAFLVLRPGAR